MNKEVSVVKFIFVLFLAIASVMAISAAGPAQCASANLFPNPGFDSFTGDLPEGWTFDSWNQPAMKVRVGSFKPGMNGSGQCLEIRRGNPMSVASLTSPVISVTAGHDYLFKGYYASNCELVTTDKRWMDAEGVVLVGNWLDAQKKPIGSHASAVPDTAWQPETLGTRPAGSFLMPLPDTQDRWIETYGEVRAPDNAAYLQIVITRRWVGGRLRFDDFSLREGRIKDFAGEFSIRSVPDEDFFPIFAWLAPSSRCEEPGTNMEGDLQHSQYALANFNVGYSARFGAKYHGSVPADDAELAKLDGDPQLWWIHGGDEPGDGAFPELARINERVRRLAPSKPFWVNLLPTYGFATLDDYDRHVKNYIDTVKPTFLTYDHYCLVGKDPQVNEDSWWGPNRDGCYFPNLEIVRKRTLEAGIDFGVILSVGTFGGVRGASDAELRWQAFTTLAYGSKALGWFCYLTEVNYGNWNNWEDMVINRDGTRTRHYSVLKYLNGEVLAWGPTLRNLNSTGVYHTAPLPPMTTPVSKSELVSSVSGGMGLIGEFKCPDGHSYVMVVNRSFIKPVTMRVKFRKAPGKLMEISRQSGLAQAAGSYSRQKGELLLRLPAGDAELFRLDWP